MRPRCTARALATGRLPGSPRQTGHVCVLGGSPKDSSQPQNILVAVASCTWISRPITGSRSSSGRIAPRFSGTTPLKGSDTPGAPIEAEALLERVGGVEQAVLAEGGAGDLQADGQAAREPAGDRDRGDAGE